MSNSALTEAERNTLADFVHRRGGDELLITEVLTWAEQVRLGQDQLELVLRGFAMPTLGDDGRLALVPLLGAVPAAQPLLDITPAPSKLRASVCPTCNGDRFTEYDAEQNDALCGTCRGRGQVLTAQGAV